MFVNVFPLFLSSVPSRLTNGLLLFLVFLFIFVQIAISAGHEFLITTDAKHAEICDDKVMYMDYVSVPSHRFRGLTGR